MRWPPCCLPMRTSRLTTHPQPRRPSQRARRLATRKKVEAAAAALVTTAALAQRGSISSRGTNIVLKFHEGSRTPLSSSIQQPYLFYTQLTSKKAKTPQQQT